MSYRVDAKGNAIEPTMECPGPSWMTSYNKREKRAISKRIQARKDAEPDLSLLKKEDKKSLHKPLGNIELRRKIMSILQGEGMLTTKEVSDRLGHETAYKARDVLQSMYTNGEICSIRKRENINKPVRYFYVDNTGQDS